MSKKVVLIISMFTLDQRIMVYNEGEKVEEISVPSLEGVADVTVGLLSKYDYSRVDIYGDSDATYLEHVGNKIKEVALEKYSNRILEINYV